MSTREALSWTLAGLAASMLGAAATLTFATGWWFLLGAAGTAWCAWRLITGAPRP